MRKGKEGNRKRRIRKRREKKNEGGKSVGISRVVKRKRREGKQKFGKLVESPCTFRQ